MFAELNRAAHYAPIIVKVGVPKGVGKHNVRGAVRTAFIGPVEETAKKGTKA
jgi:hypothetical protein